MDTKKVAVVGMVVLGIVALMALGAGAVRDRREGTVPPTRYQPGGGVKAIDAATGWLRTRLDRRRIISPCWTGAGFQFPGDCDVAFQPGSVRPSRFRLAPTAGLVQLCFAFDRERLVKCVAGSGDPKLGNLDGEKEFTVAKDSAFLHFRCAAAGGGSCGVRLD